MYPKTLLTAIAVSFAAISFANTEISTRQNYIDKYKVLAVDQMYEFGIPASIILAQAILESGNGEGTLAVRANNHFGIKCKSYWTGKTYDMKDDDYDTAGNLTESCFRAYPSAEASYRNYGEFLTGSERYSELFTYGKDYRKWAHGLKAKGYATAPGYAEKLIRLIEENNLNKFDYEPKVQQITYSLIVPVTRESTGQLAENNIDNSMLSEATASTHTQEVFELSTPVSREEIEGRQWTYELIPPVFRREVAMLHEPEALFKSPAEPMSQDLIFSSFTRR